MELASPKAMTEGCFSGNQAFNKRNLSTMKTRLACYKTASGGQAFNVV